MSRNGGRPVTSAELDAHLGPMREDIRTLTTDQREFAEFMTGAVNSRAIQETVRQSRHFWMGTAVALAGVVIAALALLLTHGG